MLLVQILNNGNVEWTGSYESFEEAQLTAEQRDQPAIICDWEDGSHTLIDGNHRACRRFLDGFHDFDAYIVPISFLRNRYTLRLEERK